jgi:hypothetical protein
MYFDDTTDIIDARGQLDAGVVLPAIPNNAYCPRSSIRFVVSKVRINFCNFQV